MAEGTPDNNAYGRSDDPAVDAAEHLAAAIGTPAWTEARERVIGLLPDDDPQVSERIEAWAAEAERHEGDDLSRFLTRSLPQWQQRISAALADDPERAQEARRFADSVQSLLPPPDGTTTQIAIATGHGTVNSVQNGNIYYQVVLGLAPRPRKTTLGKAAAITLGAGAVSAAGGLAATNHLADEAVKQAGAGHLPGAPLADPAQASATAAQTAGSPSVAGASTPGTAAAGKSGATLWAKAAAVTKAVTFGGAGVSAPVVATVVTVVVVVVTTVTIVVPRIMSGASCDAAAGDRSAPAILAEAARRVELTSFRYDVTRGRHHVTGAADPQARTAWFRQGVRGGTDTSGTIDQGKVVLPPGVTTPSGADTRWVRADGAFIDAVDPAAPARELRSVIQARRDGCTFTGTLAPATAPGASVEPAVARSSVASARPVAATSTPTADAAPVDFTARIDDRGRLVHLTTQASPDRLPVAARYWDFGLAVTASAPPSSDAPTSSENKTLTGKWTGDWSTSFGSGGFTATLSQDGERITGDLTVDGVPCSLDGSVTGTLEGDRITFGNVNSAGTISFTGSVEGNTMRGSFETDCYDTSGSWTAQRSGS
ncbi:hypothetical protein ACFW2D_21575 [Streptomyces sp. NPDC058914]|uniref:hypothetical protein n=1 Tax=Streptomyces sp. NPDC058914 TaxID=3346671 RepID=UPI0036B64C58